MTNKTISKVDMVKEADDADATAVTEEPPNATEEALPRRLIISWRWVSAGLLVALLGLGGFGYVKYTGVVHQLDAVHRADADRNAAVQLATAYALKSLTYSFEDPDAFFRSVEEGVSPALKDKYINATDLLKGIMLQAQVTSTGEVLATEATAQPGDVYQVVLSASQTTRNLQSPDPRVSISLLQITVNKVGDTWQVSDIGPKTGSQAANADTILGPQPGPAPSPLPAPKPR